MADGHAAAPQLNLTSPDGLRPAAPGYDHGWFSWAPRTSRPARTLPGGALVAVSIVLDLGAVEWERPPPVVPPPGGRGIAPYPDLPRMSHREFGHRVGVFRLLRMCDQAGIPVAAAVDVLTAEHYGRLVERLAPVVGEFLAAGLSASRPISSEMSEDEERHYIADTLRRLAAGLPTRPVGWLGAARGESARTPGLLAEAGLRYVAEWCNDDQPYRMEGAGHLWAFPLSWELSDLAATFERQVLPWTYADSIGDAVDVLAAEGQRSAPVLGLQLHPWLSGQAFRASAVEGVLRRLRSDERIWLATPGEIVDWYARAA